MPQLDDLLSRYQTWLLDAYGVLMNEAGAIPHADAFLRHLEATRQAYFVLTNDASRLPMTLSRRFAHFGLQVAPERFITSGGLLTRHFAAHNLTGLSCMVFGPTDSHAYVQEAGGVPLQPSEAGRAEAVIVCDDAGVDFQPAVEAAISRIMHRLDAGQATPLILCNPDLIYPKGHGAYGITSGSIALLIEAALRVRFGAEAPQFTRLGKPHAPIFAAAEARAGHRSLVMVGDQLGTDIAGACEYGIDSVLVCTGLTRQAAPHTYTPRPTHVCQDLRLS